MRIRVIVAQPPPHLTAVRRLSQEQQQSAAGEVAAARHGAVERSPAAGVRSSKLVSHERSSTREVGIENGAVEKLFQTHTAEASSLQAQSPIPCHVRRTVNLRALP